MLVTVQLVEAATDRHVWSTNFERDLGEFFKVQSEVARAIAAEVQVRLTPEDQARLARARVANRDTIDACLHGMHHWWQWSDEGFTNALRYFQKAIEIDPNYAPAHAGAALTYEMAVYWWFWPPRETVPKAKRAAQMAIELDPLVADSYVALGYVKLAYDWDWAGAEKDFKRAIELNPNSPAALDGYANFLVTQGRFDDAILILKTALELDPLSPALHTDLGGIYGWSGQLDRAAQHLNKALELDRNFFQAHYWLGWNWQLMGKTEEALAEFQTTIQLDPDSPMVHFGMGYALGVTGRRAEALQVLADLDQLATKRYVTSFAQAFVYLGLGRRDVALDWLEKAYEDHDSNMAFLKVDPGLASLRNEPRFQALLKKVGLDK
jgi:tetratricopeptide (TPR) repeat protein